MSRGWGTIYNTLQYITMVYNYNNRPSKKSWLMQAE